jgi:hypothetical protein
MAACLLAVITNTAAVAPPAPVRAPPAEVAVEVPLPVPAPVQETQPQRGPASDAPEVDAPPPLWRQAENVELAVVAGFVWVKCVGFPHWPAQVLPKEAAKLWVDRVPCPRGATAEELPTVCPWSRALFGGSRAAYQHASRLACLGPDSRLPCPGTQLVQFFGTSEFAWVDEEKVVGWKDGLDQGVL